MSKIFKNIAVAIITPTHTKKSFNIGLQLAKKLESDFTVIECMYKVQPKLYFFETKSDKKKAQLQVSKLKTELENWKKIAQKEGVHIKTKFALTDSVSNWVIEYVKENKIDLLIVDYPKLSMVEMTVYDDIINTIHHEAHCNLLTTKQAN